MRSYATLLMVSVLALCACASDPDNAGSGALWAQREDEAGKLPVGRVVAVRELRVDPIPALSEPAAAGIGAGASVKPSTSGVTAVATGRDTRLYRHTVQLRNGPTELLDTDYQFSVGSCIAVRSRSGRSNAVLVSALPGQCD